MEAKSIFACILKRALPRPSDFESRTGQEKSHTPAHMAFGIDAVNSNAGRGDVQGIVEIRLCVHWKSAPKHRTVAWSGTDGQNQGIRLQAADPNWIKALIEDSERSKKAPCRDGHISIGDVIDLRVVNMFVYRSAVRPTTRRALELPFEFRAGLDQPTVSQWHKKDRINLGVDQVLPGSDEAEGPDAATQDGNWLILSSLRACPCRC